MQVKFVFGGEGVKVPFTDVTFGIAIFKIWLAPVGMPFKGYTAASNQGLLGAALIESPVVDFVMQDLQDEEPFIGLHGAVVDVVITPNVFAGNGGHATLKLTKRSNDGPSKELTCFSDECKGVSAAGEIRFTTTLLTLPENEQDPHSFPPIF